jgi:hypothetical protein
MSKWATDTDVYTAFVQQLCLKSWLATTGWLQNYEQAYVEFFEKAIET